MIAQQTVRSSVSCSGITLHSGVRTLLTLCPAPENTGIVFRRVDVPGRPEVRAHVSNVVDVQRATTLASGQAVVVTVEHVLAALHALNVDNCFVEMNNIEPPIMDGSSLPYVEMIQRAGIVEQNAPAKIWTASAPIIIEEKDTKLVLTPADELKITCLVSFGATPLDTQYFSTVINAETFEREISRARTFCQYKELEYLLAAGLAKGGSLDNAAVIHNGAIISKDGLRYPTELVRHKMLDIVGDLFLCGARVRAHVIAVKPGHPTNVMLAKKMLEQSSTYSPTTPTCP